MPESAPNSGHAVLDGLYELHDTVGTGGFAKVKVATHLQTGLKVNPQTDDKGLNLRKSSRLQLKSWTKDSWARIYRE